MFGDFTETISHPRKSIKDPKITLKGINKGLLNTNWQFDNNRAYFWGGNRTIQNPKWNKNDSLDIVGIPETNKWTLILDVKFGGTKDEVVGEKY